MTDLAKLIERLEAAGEGSEELDRQIAHTMLKPGITISVLKWTRSLDAALTLVPEGWWADISTPIGDNDAQADLFTGQPPYYQDEEITVCAATPALALCIAALKARAA